MVEHETTTETDFRNELSDQLRNNVCEVIFIQKNGDERVMNCTLMEAHLPTSQTETNGKSKKVENKEILVVWDLDKQAWRSFRLDSMVRFSISRPSEVPIL